MFANCDLCHRLILDEAIVKPDLVREGGALYRIKPHGSTMTYCLINMNFAFRNRNVSQEQDEEKA